MARNLVSISILISSTLISIAILVKIDLDFLQKLFSVVGSFSILVALATYFYTRKQDETVAAIDQISFFRDQIIPEWARVRKIIFEKNRGYWFSRIEIEQQDIDFLRKKFSRNFENQKSIFFDSTKDDPAKWIDESIADRQILLLNMLEEFSLRVKHFNSLDNPALSAIYPAFIDIVEKNVAIIFFVRDITVADKVIYAGILSLYEVWKKKVNKSKFIQNLEKYDFITKKQREDIFNKKRESSKKETAKE